jgi:hypothetical protein
MDGAAVLRRYFGYRAMMIFCSEESIGSYALPGRRSSLCRCHPMLGILNLLFQRMARAF